jgi:hypothetical protein
MHAVRVYIQSGLVQHVDADITVRIIDLDTEGSPKSDLHKLSQRDIMTLPDGLKDQRRGFITNWLGGRAVSRG